MVHAQYLPSHSCCKSPRRPEAFDGLFLPCTLRAGHLEELVVQLPLGMVLAGPATLKVKALYVLAGPSPMDWTDEQAQQSKARLIDLVSRSALDRKSLEPPDGFQIQWQKYQKWGVCLPYFRFLCQMFCLCSLI